jgi:signal transduction histidine kinase
MIVPFRNQMEPVVRRLWLPTRRTVVSPVARSGNRPVHLDPRRLAEEQDALRRVATLVARGVPPLEVFNAVVAELGHLLQVELTQLNQHDADGQVTVVSSWAAQGETQVIPPVGSRWQASPDSVTGQALRNARPERMAFAGQTSGLAGWAASHGIKWGVAAPIMVEGRPWGVTVALSRAPAPQPLDSEERMLRFNELVAVAIANAESRAELKASRARVVAAADEARRRIERDLHDGAQQRLVSLSLGLRRAEADVPRGHDDLRRQLVQSVDLLDDILTDLREVSRGIHPAILSTRGLKPALKMLARRSTVPVALNVHDHRRLPTGVEVAVYYVVSEALTNVAKHAKASVVEVDLGMDTETVRVSIVDDGVGGAAVGSGSGLIGLRDRVEALGGRLEIRSRAREGTSLFVRIPVGGC